MGEEKKQEKNWDEVTGEYFGNKTKLSNLKNNMENNKKSFWKKTIEMRWWTALILMFLFYGLREGVFDISTDTGRRLEGLSSILTLVFFVLFVNAIVKKRRDKQNLKNK